MPSGIIGARGVRAVRLREIRIRKLYSIRGLAEVAGLSDSTVRTVESGQVRPSLSTIRKLSTLLDIDPMEVDEFKEAMKRAIGEN